MTKPHNYRAMISRRGMLRAAMAGAVGVVAACSRSRGAAPESMVPSVPSATPPPRRPPSRQASVNEVAAENARRGDPRWRIDRLGDLHEIEGWADRASVVPGQPVKLHISTTAPAYRVTAIRTGWYGGAQGRRVWRSPVLRGQLGAPPRVVEPTRTVVTDWPASLTVDTTGWVPGFYLFRLDARTGGQRYIPLAVRSGNAAGKVVLINGDTTWQAYNPFGGYSLYQGPDGAFATRARAVSFDRPYGGISGQGDSEFQENLLPLVSLVEKLGIAADYVSDIDLHDHPHLLDGAVAVLSPGHDEYYSTQMRAALTKARDAGTNLAFLGANAIYRHIRLDASSQGPSRLQTCYKVPEEDPFYWRDAMEATGQWRYAPHPRPESVLTGVFYESNPVRADMIVANPEHWLFAGSGARQGTVLPGLVGGEYDRVNLTVETPRPLEILAHSPLVCNGNASHSDMAYYTTPSGAGVLSTGTNSWINALSGAWGPVSQRVTRAATTTLLREYVGGPVGRRHPAKDNVGRYV